MAAQLVTCQQLTRRFFEWDASLVRDGTYYAALLHAKAGGSAEDIAVCIQALNVSLRRRSMLDTLILTCRNFGGLTPKHGNVPPSGSCCIHRFFRPCVDNRLRNAWASNQPAAGVSGWGPSLEATQNYFLAPIPEGMTSLDGSLSGSGSAYTSPDTISLNETFSAPMSATGVAPMQHVYTVLTPTVGGGEPYQTIYGSHVGPPPFMGVPLPPRAQVIDLGPPSMYPQQNLQHPHAQQAQAQPHSHLSHHDPSQAVTGQYVVQPDGSQVFIQYS